MASHLNAELQRPLTLAILGVAIVGWGLVLYFLIATSSMDREFKQRLADLERARLALVSELDRQRQAAGTLAELQQRRGSAGRELAEAKAQLDQAAARLAATRQDMAAAAQQLSALENERSAKSAEVSALDRNLDRLQAQKAALERDLAQAADDRARLVAEIRSAETRRDTLEHELGELAAGVSARAAELDSLQRRLHDAAQSPACASATGPGAGALDTPAPLSGADRVPCRQTDQGWICGTEDPKAPTSEPRRD